jgi:hypothetical protein
LVNLREEKPKQMTWDLKKSNSFKSLNEDIIINKDIDEIIDNYESICNTSEALSPTSARFQYINIDGRKSDTSLKLIESPRKINNIPDLKIEEASNDNDDSMIINEIIKNSQIRLLESKDVTEIQINKKSVGFSDEVTYIGYSDKYNIKNLLILSEDGRLLRKKTQERIRHKPSKDRDYKPNSIMKETYIRKISTEKKDDSINRSTSRSIGI